MGEEERRRSRSWCSIWEGMYVGPSLREWGYLSTMCYIILFERHQLSPQRFAPPFCKTASQEDTLHFTPLSIKGLNVTGAGCAWQVSNIGVAALSWNDRLIGWLALWGVNPKDGAQQGHVDSSEHDVNKGGRVSRQKCNQSSQCWLKQHICCA